MRINDITIKLFPCMDNMNLHQCFYAHLIIYLVTSFNVCIKEVYNLYIWMWHCQKTAFRNNISNTCFRCIWLNGMYIIPIFYRNTLSMTMALAQHFVIYNGSLYVISYLKIALLLSMNLSPTLYLWSNFLPHWGYYIN